MAEKSRRILIFTTAFRPMIGGSEIAIEEIAARLPEVFFDIITPRYKKHFLSQESSGNTRVFRVGPPGIIGKLLFPLTGPIRALQLTRERKYAAMHAYQASFGGGAAWCFKTLAPRLPFILTLQEGKDFEKQGFLINYFRNMIIRKADEITAISNYLAQYARQVSPKTKVRIIPNGVDYSKFMSAGSHDPKTVITSSRLVKKNGLEDLIDAIAIVRKEIPDIKLMILGGEPLLGGQPLREVLKSKVRSLGLEGSVEFLGEIPYAALPGHLAKAGIFVRPSLSEGLGTAFLEAMAAGLAVIGTPVGGIPDFLKDGETGLFCNVSDPRDLAKKIVILVNDSQLREKLTSNAARLVAGRYNWSSVALQFKQLYAEL